MLAKDDEQKEKVISLAERRKAKQRSQDEDAPLSSPAGSEAAEAAGPEKEAAPLGPIPGKLIWLHCPTCGTMQYTEVFMTGGRTHDSCGTQVKEAVVDIDVRAEFTLAGINLERLRALGSLLESQRARYEQYRERLGLMAGGEPEPYPLTEETLKALPVAEVDVLGLLVPNALLEPARRFAPPGGEPQGGESGAPQRGEGEEPPPDSTAPPPKD